MPKLDFEPCDPPIGPISFTDDEQPAVTARLQELFVADQAARQSSFIDWNTVLVEDAQRRREALAHLHAGHVGAALSLYHAAFIFQHGNCPEHFDLAHQLAEQAIRRGCEQARWIYAASLDRALMSRGLPQKYGTQYIAYDNGPLELYEYDRTTTDQERAEYAVPPLHELLRRHQTISDNPFGGWFTMIVDEDMQNMQLPDHYQDVMNRFMAACQADERIVAAFLGGSYVEGKADKYSDLDLFFITTDQAYETFLLERENFIRLLGEPLFLEDFGKPHGNFVIYSTGADCEIWFGRESNFHDIHGGAYKALLDKKGILAGAVFPIHVADEVEQIEILRQQLDWFWHELSHFIKAMARQQLWFAYGQIEVLRQICVNLARLRYDFSDAYGGKEPYFKLEQAMPIEQLSSLETTYCSMEYEPMLRAGHSICNFYRDIAPSLAKAHNLIYQNGLEIMLMRQLEELNDIHRN